jgi:hypothetical protein
MCSFQASKENRRENRDEEKPHILCLRKRWFNKISYLFPNRPTLGKELHSRIIDNCGTVSAWTMIATIIAQSACSLKNDEALR